MNDDTGEIEEMLRGYRPAGPEAGVRERVMRRAIWHWRWALMESVAAALLIAMNLAQIGGSGSQVIARPAVSEGQTRRLAAEIARLDLSVGGEEVYAMAQRLSAGEGLVQVPIVHGDPSMDMNMGAMQ